MTKNGLTNGATLMQNGDTPESGESHSQKNNSFWCQRAAVELERLISQATEERGFWGSVVVEVIWKQGNVVGFDASLRQQVRI